MDNGTHFATIPNKALRDRRLSDGAFRLLGVLASYLNAEGFCYPSYDLLAADCDCSKRSIMRNLQELINLNYVIKRHMYKDNEGQTSNLYYVKYDEIPAEDKSDKNVIGGSDTSVTGEGDKNVTPGVTPESPKVYIREVYSSLNEKNNAHAREALKEKKKDIAEQSPVTEADIERWQEVEREMQEVFSKSEMSYIRAVEFWKIDANKIHVYTATRFITEHLQGFDFESRFLAMESVRGFEFTFGLNCYNLPEEYYKLNKTA